MGGIATVMKAASDRPVISSIAGSAVLITSILGGAKALDIRLIPWATASELEAVAEQALDQNKALLDVIKQISLSQSRLAKENRVLLRAFWESKRDEAEEDLKVNPRSRTAQEKIVEANRAMAELDRQEVADGANR